MKGQLISGFNLLFQTDAQAPCKALISGIFNAVKKVGFSGGFDLKTGIQGNLSQA